MNYVGFPLIFATVGPLKSVKDDKRSQSGLVGGTNYSKSKEIGTKFSIFVKRFSFASKILTFLLDFP